MTQLSILECSKSLSFTNGLNVLEKEEGGDFLSVFSEAQYSSQRKKASQEETIEEGPIYTEAYPQSVRCQDIKKGDSAELESPILESAWFSTSISEESSKDLDSVSGKEPQLLSKAAFKEGLVQEDCIQEKQEPLGSDTNLQASFCAEKPMAAESLQRIAPALKGAQGETASLQSKTEILTDQGSQSSPIPKDLIGVNTFEAGDKFVSSDFKYNSEAPSPKGPYTQGLYSEKNISQERVLDTMVPEGVKHVSEKLLLNKGLTEKAEPLSASEALLEKTEALELGKTSSFQGPVQLNASARPLEQYGPIASAFTKSKEPVLDNPQPKATQLLALKSSESKTGASLYQEGTIAGFSTKAVGIYKSDTEKQESAERVSELPLVPSLALPQALSSGGPTQDTQEPLASEKVQSDVVSLIADYFDKIKAEGKAWTRLSLGGGKDHPLHLYIRMQGKRIGIRLEDAPFEVREDLLNKWPELSKIADRKGMYLEALDLFSRKNPNLFTQQSASTPTANHLNMMI